MSALELQPESRTSPFPRPGAAAAVIAGEIAPVRLDSGFCLTRSKPTLAKPFALLRADQGRRLVAGRAARFPVRPFPLFLTFSRTCSCPFGKLFSRTADRCIQGSLEDRSRREKRRNLLPVIVTIAHKSPSPYLTLSASRESSDKPGYLPAAGQGFSQFPGGLTSEEQIRGGTPAACRQASPR